MVGDLFINGYDAYSTWGIGLEDGGLSALMTPSNAKTNITNECRLEDGVRVVVIPKKAQREVSLSFHLVAPTKALFYTRYNAFCNDVLATGELKIKTRFQPNVTYRFTYDSCTQFGAYNESMALFSLKLTETNPSNRGL